MRSSLINGLSLGPYWLAWIGVTLLASLAACVVTLYGWLKENCRRGGRHDPLTIRRHRPHRPERFNAIHRQVEQERWQARVNEGQGLLFMVHLAIRLLGGALVLLFLLYSVLLLYAWQSSRH